MAGRYEILSLVGRGGMSVVYKARNRAVGSIVAVKTLKQDLLADEELFARFCQEAKAVQLLTHPNIVTMHEFGVTLDGQPFMAMDLLQGRTLADILDESGRIGVKRCLRIFIQICDALSHAHSHNILHRDIKPGNIMVVDTANEVDVAKIFDFGFAKFLEKPGRRVQALTQVGDVLGTPLYMSPEQSAGKALDSRSDIYSVGCVMYEALTGRAPLIGENVLDTMQKQINEKPLSLDTARPDLFIPEPITTILFKTLEKDPGARYQSMCDLRRDLEVAAMGLSGKAVGEGNYPGLSKLKDFPTEREFTPDQSTVNLVVALLTLAVVSIAVIWYMHRSAEQSAAVHMPAPLPVPASGTQTQAMPPPSLPTFKKATAGMSSDPRKALPLVSDLARNYLRAGMLLDAEEAANRAIVLLKATGHTNDRPAADMFAVSGDIYLAQQNYKKADIYLQKSLSIQQRELGPTDPSLVATLTSLAKAAEGQQDLSRADAYSKQALAIQQSK